MYAMYACPQQEESWQKQAAGLGVGGGGDGRAMDTLPGSDRDSKMTLMGIPDWLKGC